MKHLLPLLFLAMACAQSAEVPQTADVEREILALVEAQAVAWNTGDLEGFMEPYWKSDSLIFIGRNGITRGWQATLDRYKASYPTKEAMGTLRFEHVHLEANAAMAWQVGTWTLYRSADTLSGYFTTQWQKKEEKWVMVADHSS